MRYIEADKTLAFISRLLGGLPLALLNECEKNGIDIVRCKECVYWKAYETWSECELWTDDPYESAKTNADDYCSYGEREGE